MGRRTIVGALLAAALLVAGCEVPPPEGDYPLRYRDMTFSVQETPDQVYGEVDGQRLQLDVYAPAGDRATKRPVMLWMHGGGFKFGSRKDGMMVELARRFARRGYVAVSISYRLLAAEACGGEASVTSCTPAVMAAADDERMAIRWLKANAATLRIDPNRIAIGGASAGAVTSILAGATPDGPQTQVRGVYSISGALPFNGVFDPGDPPMFFWHGTEDTVVPYKWAYDNVSYLVQHGFIAGLRDVRGAGHVPSAYLDDMDEQARNFVYRVTAAWGADQATG